MSICDAVPAEVPSVSVSDAADQVCHSLLGVLENHHKLSTLVLSDVRKLCGYGPNDTCCETKDQILLREHGRVMSRLNKGHLLDYPDSLIPEGASIKEVRKEVYSRFLQIFDEHALRPCEQCKSAPGKIYGAYAQRLCIECATARDNA